MTARPRIQYLVALYRQRVFGKFFGLAWLLWGFAAFFRDEIAIPDDDKRWKAVNLVLSISSTTWILVAIVLLGAWLFESSFRLLGTLQNQNRELRKVDREDLQRLLRGMYFRNHFMFSGDRIHVCENFKNATEIEQLRDVFVEMQAPVPKNSIACIRLQFLNGHPPSGSIQFFYRDPQGNPQRIENIYEDVQILTDERAKIALKIVYGGGYELHESASLMVSATGWIK